MQSAQTLGETPWIQYLDGRAFPKVSPKMPHWVVQGNMQRIVALAAGDRGVVGPELHVYPGRVDGTATVFVPDISFVSWERIDAIAEREAEEPRSPELAIEVRSSSNSRAYLREKIVDTLPPARSSYST